jgi:erythrocyte band 7 integral membrane protein
MDLFYKKTLDVAPEPWGVKVERVEVKDVRVPAQLMRAMAAEAEAAREARVKVIAAEGEHKAIRSLRQAAEVIMDSPAALQVNFMRKSITFNPSCFSSVICKHLIGFLQKTTAQLYFQFQ